MWPGIQCYFQAALNGDPSSLSLFVGLLVLDDDDPTSLDNTSHDIADMHIPSPK